VQNLRRVNSEVIAAVLATATTALEDSLTGVRDGGLLLSWPSVDRELNENTLRVVSVSVSSSPTLLQ